jgi:hypothetical protein
MSKRTAADTDKWSIFKPLFTQIEVPAKTLLLEEGNVSKTMFFIEKGCVRTWVNNNGKDITTQFFFEVMACPPLKALWLINPACILLKVWNPV